MPVEHWNESSRVHLQEAAGPTEAACLVNLRIVNFKHGSRVWDR